MHSIIVLTKKATQPKNCHLWRIHKCWRGKPGRARSIATNAKPNCYNLSSIPLAARPHLTAALIAVIVALPPSCCCYTTLVVPTRCQQAEQPKQENDRKQKHSSSSIVSSRKQLLIFFRMFARAIKVSVTMTPLLLFYPLHRILSWFRYLTGKHDDEEELSFVLDWWMQLCLWCVEHNGAATVKLMQWASSRPDMFGERFCERFRRLQDSTTPHSWKHTENVLTQAYGPDWKQKVQLHEILGSGCIGQVYKGTATDDSGIQQNVAVKVIHPNVRGPIDTDLELLRFVVSAVESLPFNIGANLQWWNLKGAADEFSQLLKVQLDFRKEAENLERFNVNFKNDPHVVFPKSVKGFIAHPDVLVETFVEGIPISKFAAEHKSDTALLHKMCEIGIDTVCRMIFYHNFVHSDLHPGNILASLSDDGVPRFVLLDVGMVTEFKDADHDNIIDILANIVRRNGRKAAELMIQDSEKKTSPFLPNKLAVLNREEFINKIAYLTDQDRDMSFFENIGGYIVYICNAAATHHVRLNEAFASIALAVKVQEGVALSLDPKCHVWETANPIIVRAEMKRRFNRFFSRISDEISTFKFRNMLQDDNKCFLD